MPDGGTSAPDRRALLAELVAELLQATDARRRKALENEVAGVVRGVVVTQLRGYRDISGPDADDVANATTLRVIEKLRTGPLDEPGKELGYVLRAARNAAIDQLRKQQRKGRKGQVELDDTRRLPAAPVPVAPKELQPLVERALADPRLSAAHREVLTGQFVQGKTPNDLAAEELARHPTDRKGRPRTLEQARDTIDQRIKRARDWLKMWAIAHRDELDDLRERGLL